MAARGRGRADRRARLRPADGGGRDVPRRLPRGAEAYSSKTPRTRLRKIRFFGDEDDEFEEYNAEGLAKYLSRAHDEGVRGPAPEAGSEQLTTLPKACTAAVAEEDGEVE